MPGGGPGPGGTVESPPVLVPGCDTEDVVAVVAVDAVDVVVVEVVVNMLDEVKVTNRVVVGIKIVMVVVVVVVVIVY